MKISKPGFFFLLISVTIFSFLFFQSISAQEKMMGEITITGSSAPENQRYVTVNGERVSSGRTINSPSDISTPKGTNAKVTLAKTGTVLISPDTEFDLSFVGSSISGILTKGEITLETISGTKISIQTLEGTITVPDENQSNIIKISVADGKARINTLVGKAMFNTAIISAGEYFPTQTQAANQKPDKDNGNNTLLIILLIGGAAAAALVGLSVASGGNNESAPVSPFR